jgi:HEAT repeat protein
MSRCDKYWDGLSAIHDERNADRVRLEYAHYVSAVNELSRRGREVLEWARLRLEHKEYDAREQAAFFVGELARCGKISSEELPDLIEALSKLALRPWREDTKEAQANTAAIIALRKTKDPRAVPALVQIVMSSQWENDENAWEAACALGDLVGQPFAKAADPLRAARTWAESTRL